MRFEIRKTKDGSLTVYDAQVGECYKSSHAAQLEVDEVFIRSGIEENIHWNKVDPFRVLELGFGLGTCFLRLLERKLSLHYISIERDLEGARFFTQHIPPGPLNKILAGETFFSFLTAQLIQGEFQSALPELQKQKSQFHCIFFDPFSPKVNPDAWTKEIFTHCYQLLAPGGRLVTYSVSRIAKDAALHAGFQIKKRDLPILLQKRNALLAEKPLEP